MGDNLAETLYHAHRRALSDPTAAPAWGNLLADDRAAWEAVAAAARTEMSKRFVLTLKDAMATEKRDVAWSALDDVRERWDR
jgi:hypothetical protein